MFLLFFDLFIEIVQELYSSATVGEFLLYPDGKTKELEGVNSLQVSLSCLQSYFIVKASL